MGSVTQYPLPVFVLSFFVLWLSARLGAFVLQKQQALKEELRGDFGVILTTTLTLLGLLIGFSFSMAMSRYDQRKALEEAEANAIGTEYLRADLLPAADAVKVRALLSDYLEQRIVCYATRDEQELEQSTTRTARLQTQLWSAVVAPSAAQPTAVAALAVSGMNDVLNSQGYTQAAWLNHIPTGAWWLMAVIAVCSNVLVGFGTRSAQAERRLLLVLPLVVSIAFLLIADMDSPRHGMIRVRPQNLSSLAGSLRAPGSR